MKSVTVGNMSAISRPARRDVLVSSSLATAKRSTSTGSRTNARTTRIPVIWSRRTALTRSTRSCIFWNVGTMRVMITASTPISAGMATSMITDSPTSSRIAKTIPNTIVIGAAIIIVQARTTSIWTCWTSLVTRVISDGAPNWPTSRAE